MDLCFFVSDLHGSNFRYKKLFKEIIQHKPKVVFIGGDILPSIGSDMFNELDFINDYFAANLLKIKNELGKLYPRIFIIMGNDDPRIEEQQLIEVEKAGLWEYIHFRKVKYKDFNIYGYSYIPPTPFLFKDWEKYDVSVYVDPGCVHPTEGYRSVEPLEDISFTNISKDLEKLTEKEDLSKSIFLFHSPPYKTFLDRADLDGKMIDHVPFDVHVGSIAIQRFIEERQPFMTLHGHIHESSRLTGHWHQRINNTYTCSAAYDGHELALISFYLQDLSSARRCIL